MRFIQVRSRCARYETLVKSTLFSIIEIVSLFEECGRDRSSLVEIKAGLQAGEFGTQRARNVFENALEVEKNRWSNTLLQRAFEEACAKALYSRVRLQRSWHLTGLSIVNVRASLKIRCSAVLPRGELPLSALSAFNLSKTGLDFAGKGCVCSGLE